jgi:glucose-6-phosphate dehydrogenase assembly protein OpcA
MRMYGRLALHAESVTLPLLAPDAPVVTWWHGAPPDKIAYDPLGVFADRRITDCERAEDPHAALAQRAADYVPADTDLAWTRTTLWRASLASAFDTLTSEASAAEVQGRDKDPSSLLLAGWLTSRLGLTVPVVNTRGGGIEGVSVKLSDGHALRLHRASGSNIVLERGGTPDSTAAQPERDLGDLLAEELRHLDADQPYGEALAAAFGQQPVAERVERRHIWHDPMAPAEDTVATDPQPATQGSTPAAE